MRVKMISNFGTAIHTLLIIHEFSKTQKVTSEVIGGVLGANPVVVRQLLPKLKKAGFISVAPRKEKAGTTMAKPVDQITLFDVFKAVEPNYMQKLIKNVTWHSHISQTGIFANEIIADYIKIILNGVKEEMEKITLADALAELIQKETEYPHDNPRELFEKIRDSEIDTAYNK